jgi:hypothetical protein
MEENLGDMMMFVITCSGYLSVSVPWERDPSKVMFGWRQ